MEFPELWDKIKMWIHTDDIVTFYLLWDQISTVVLMKRARGVCTGSARQGRSTALRQHGDERCKEGLRGTPGADGRGEYRGAI